MAVNVSSTHRHSAIITCLLVLLIPGRATAQPAVVLKPGQSRWLLGPHLSYLEDRNRAWKLRDLTVPPLSGRFERSQTLTPSFGFKTSAFWFRWSVRSEHGPNRRFLLALDYPMIDRIELFVPLPDGQFARKVTGDSFPFGLKEIRHESFLFLLRIPPGTTQTFYLRVQTEGSLQLPLTLWTLEGFWEQKRTSWTYWTVYGLVLIVFFYNLFLHIATRDRTYLWFVLYVACMFTWLFSSDGLAQAYLWPAYPWWANRAIPFSLCGCSFFGVLTTLWFLDLEHTLRRWNSLLGALGLMALVGMLLSLVVPYNPITIFAAFWVAPCSTLIWVVSILCWRKGYKPARYYVAAWSVLFIGVGMISFSRLGLIPSTPLIENAWIIGSALNVGLISIALTDRINLMKRQKDHARAEALRIQQQAAASLERDVEEKTRVLQQKAEELEQAYTRLAEQDRLKSSFFANVSHELRTPLTLILTPLRWLLAGKSGQVPAAIQDRLRSMEGNAQRLLRLVNQLLDFSRIEYGGMIVSYAVTDIQALAHRTVDAFRPFARGKGIHLDLRGPEQAPRIVTDPGNLEKVLANLLSNACKFTASGGSVVVRLSEEAGWLKVSIKDTGIGISEKELSRVFERFHQADLGASRRQLGTGIGLALSKELIELAGGRLELQSEQGLGSTFTVWLPLGTGHVPDPALIRADPVQPPDAVRAEAAATALAAEGGMGGSPGPDEQDAQRPLMVVVEDNPDMRTLVADICHEHFRVVEAADGQAGLDLIQLHRPALVVADAMTPRIDGHELLRRVRAAPATATIPMILLTAGEDVGSRLEQLESGADDYLVKPFEPRELRARAYNMVRLQEQERSLRELNRELQQRVVEQAATLEREQKLGRFLPPQVMKRLLLEEQGQQLETWQQRSQLTVFLLELRGFEHVMDRAVPEELAALINGYLSEMAEVAFSHSATLQRFARDRVTGFFGAPQSEGGERDALRCTRMALQMWQRACAVCERWQEVLGRGAPAPTMVLATGHCTVGYFGSRHRQDYAAIGEPVDEAREILAQLEPGELCCSHSTWMMIHQEAAGELRGKSTVMHRARPIKVYRLAGPPSWMAAGARAWATIPPETDLQDTLDASPADGAARIDGEEGGAAVELIPGTRIGTRYEVLDRIGEGGMAVVLRARDLKLQIDVALKVLRGDLTGDARQLEQLYQEVRLARLINHPSVARLFDIGEWQGREFVSMELIEGRSLARRLEQGDPLPLAEGLRILEQLCEGLAAAHAARIVHRDLKPSNIMLAPGGRVVILDFGVAQLLSQEQQPVTEPRADLVGTPCYLAPEQIEGKQLDLRTDLYALGVIAYEMFTGTLPFVGDRAIALAYQHVHIPPPDPLKSRPDLPPRLAAVILRCLEKSPAKRFQSVTEICSLLPGLGS